MNFSTNGQSNNGHAPQAALEGNGARPRVLIGGIYHETHSFLPGVSGASDFGWVRGQGILDSRVDSSPLGGALSIADECNWDLIPVLDVRGGAGATVTDVVIEAWWREWEVALRLARGQFEAIFLNLHGAMVSESLRDVEGEMLSRLRALVGPEVLIAGVTDLHGNFSPLMAQSADVLLTYRENPHTDGFESGCRAAFLLQKMLTEGARPRTFMARAPLIWTPSGTGTNTEPMASLEKLAREFETQNPDFWAVNVHGGFCFSDTPDTGVTFSVVSTGEEAIALDALNRLIARAWHLRALGARPEPALEKVLPQVAAHLHSRPVKKRPIVIAEPSDNIGGGAPGDGTHLLRALLETDFAVLPTQNGRARADVLIGATLWDAKAVEMLADLAVGQKIVLKIGGHSGPLAGAPLKTEVELVAHSDGFFRIEDPHSHLAAGGQCDVDMGPSALIRIRSDDSAIKNSALVLLTSKATCPFDLGQWKCVGVEPRGFDIIAVKAAVAHRQAYDPIALANFAVSTPGPCASDLIQLPFVHLPRPSYPLDADEETEIGSSAAERGEVAP